ncbi:MAG: zf-HC2 domain-containing protein [Clostridiales bacterium]|nr:zf-HC2 domain-containing protein [Clostridiales bacterium]
MRCLNAAEIYAYLENDLLPERRADIDEHLDLCAKCRQAIEERRHLTEAALSLPNLEVPHDLARRVMAKISSPAPSLPVWLTAFIVGLSSLGLLSFLLILSGGKGAITILAGFNHAVLVYLKNSIVWLAKAMTLLTSAWKAIQTLALAFFKGISLLTTLTSPGVQALILTMTLAALISLYLAFKKILLQGEKT